MHNNMKNRFTPFLIHAAGVGALALLCQTAQSQITAYSDTSTYEGANFNFANGAGGEAGQEIVLAGTLTSLDLTAFQVNIDFTGTGTPTGTVDVSLYQNNGALYNGYASPGSLISDLGSASLSSFTTGSGALVGYNGLNIIVPKDFTYIVTFSGLTATENAGLAIYGTASVGQNYHDAWVNTASGYQLQVATGSLPTLEFGATVSTTAIPEPSTIALGVMGACGFLARRRRN
jgi:hypothetical protein